MSHHGLVVLSTLGVLAAAALPAQARVDSSRCSAMEELDFGTNQCVPLGTVGNGYRLFFWVPVGDAVMYEDYIRHHRKKHH